MWRTFDVWRPTPGILRRYRCAEAIDGSGLVVVTMEFVSAKDSDERRAQQEGYYLEQLAEVHALERSASLAEAIGRHDAAFENE